MSTVRKENIRGEYSIQTKECKYYKQTDWNINKQKISPRDIFS